MKCPSFHAHTPLSFSCVSHVSAGFVQGNFSKGEIIFVVKNTTFSHIPKAAKRETGRETTKASCSITHGRGGGSLSHRLEIYPWARERERDLIKILTRLNASRRGRGRRKKR